MAESTQIVENEPKKRRLQYDKVGKYQYLLRKLDKLDRRLKAIEVVLRFMAKGLEPEMVFESQYVQDIACEDEVDSAILEELRGAGEYGMLPRDVAMGLDDKRFTRFTVTKRLKRMNKRLDAILGQRVAEKRGKNWALTSFIREAWNSTKEDAH